MGQSFPLTSLKEEGDTCLPSLCSEKTGSSVTFQDHRDTTMQNAACVQLFPQEAKITELAVHIGQGQDQDGHRGQGRTKTKKLKVQAV
jgi:hypothetical protein